MSLDRISFCCDIPGCGAWVSAVDVATVEDAFEQVSRRCGWSTREGEDFCGPCTRAAVSGEATP